MTSFSFDGTALTEYGDPSAPALVLIHGLGLSLPGNGRSRVLQKAIMSSPMIFLGTARAAIPPKPLL